MDARRVHSLGVFVAFFCIFLASCSEGNRRLPDKTSHGIRNVHRVFNHIDQHTAEEVWAYCRKELERITEANEDFNLYLPDLSNVNPNSDVASLRRTLIRKAINDLPPQVRQSLLLCLKSKRPSSCDPKKEGWRELFFRLYGYNDHPRRSLVRRHHHRQRRVRPLSVLSLAPERVEASPPEQTGSPAKAPRSIHPISALSLAPEGEEASSPKQADSPAKAPSSKAPSPARADAPSGEEDSPSGEEDTPSGEEDTDSPSSSSPSPKRGPPPSDRPPSPRGRSPPPPLDPEPSPRRPAPKPLPDEDSPPQKKPKSPPVSPPAPSNNEHKLLIAVIVTTAVATLAIFALFLVCCFGGNDSRTGPTVGKRDEKPLLNISTSDISGTSQLGQSAGINKDPINSSNTNNLSGGAHTTSTGGQVLGVQVLGEALPLPPGKTAPPAAAPQPPPPAPPAPPAAPPAPPKPPAPKAPPPPPPKGARAPNPPKPGMKRPPPPGGQHNRARSTSGDDKDQTGDSDGQKTKLKPFFWDKVNANPDHSMVWHEIKAGSFQFNEEMMESLFGYAPNADKKERKAPANIQSQPKLIQIIDPKKAQNLAILLKALNVTTEEVCDALKEGNELPVELVSTLLKMAPTQEEELKLRLYSGDLALLGPAERFLKLLVEIPFAFKRLEALLFISMLQEESPSVKESFSTLEVACTKLKNSRLFLKLLEAVLKTGNRMNDGTYRGGAQAFKLDTLLKLSDVKGTDGKTTLLSFVVQEIIRSEGIKAARSLKASRSLSSVKTDDLLEEPVQETPEYYRNLGLEVVSKLGEELEDVKKAALIDGDALTSTVSKLGHTLKKTKDFLNDELKTVEEESEFCSVLTDFVEHAESDVIGMLQEEKRIMALVKSTGDYFHGNSGKDEGLRLFVIVRDFLRLLDKTCEDIRKAAAIQAKSQKKEAQPTTTPPPPPQETRQQSLPNIRDKLFPAIKDRQMDYSSSSSDDED